MIKYFFKIAYRNLLRSKGFSVINITGLAIGMMAAILIGLWIQNEINYDSFHKNKDRIYAVWNRVPFGDKIECWDGISDPAGPAIQKDLPEVERMVRINGSNNALFSI